MVIKTGMDTPDWAMILIDDVFSLLNPSREKLEVLWRKSPYGLSSGWASTNDLDEPVISICEGTEPRDRKNVVLHECIHVITDRFHDRQFYEVLIATNRMYGIPVSYTAWRHSFHHLSCIKALENLGHGRIASRMRTLRENSAPEDVDDSTTYRRDMRGFK